MHVIIELIKTVYLKVFDMIEDFLEIAFAATVSPYNASIHKDDNMEIYNIFIRHKNIHRLVITLKSHTDISYDDFYETDELPYYVKEIDKGKENCFIVNNLYIPNFTLMLTKHKDNKTYDIPMIFNNCVIHGERILGDNLINYNNCEFEGD